VAGVYVFEDCELDPQVRELRRGGGLVHVEPQVFDVLVHLLVHRERVVSKAELLDAVWGSRFVTDSALTSRMKAARRAIGDDGHDQRLVATVHGVGYRFIGTVREVPDTSALLHTPAPSPSAPSLSVTEPSMTGPSAGAVPDRADRWRACQEIRYCRAPDGARIAYATSGSGPPLVKAANWLTHLDLEWSSPIWSHWMDALSTANRLVRYDERGCGMSDWDVDDFSLDAWVEDLELVVDSAGLDRFPLIGISQGGAVAISYAVAHPEKVSRLVLVGAYARGRLVRAIGDEEREEADLDLRVGRVAWRREDPAYRQVFAAQFLPEAQRPLWDDFVALQQATTSTENVVRFLDCFANLDVSAIAGAVACPTLILHCRRDRRVPIDQARELAALIPDSVLHLLDSGNHIVTATEPAWGDLVTQLRSFLASDRTPTSVA
jgi:pimeloyl-ACP methyl ester carboxylesterase/DNA-binding winged helix-turn-helix (wHTH) protein